MFKLIKKIIFIILLISIELTISISKIIYNTYKKNKSNIERIIRSIKNVLKEELAR